MRMQHLNRRHKKKQKGPRLKIIISPKESAKKSNNRARQALACGVPDSVWCLGWRVP
jgi:hypothetical protein